MNQQQLIAFLSNMFESKNSFASVNGVANSMDLNYMLVTDAASENIELLSEVIKEYLETNLKNYYSPNKLNRVDVCAKKRVKSI